MDPTLVGVIIGSVLSFLGTSIGQLLNIRRDGNQWEREQLARERELVREEERRRRVEEQEAKARLREIYQECIQALSTIVADQREQLKLSAEERSEIFRTANRWLSLLSLHRQAHYSSSNDSFFRDFDLFVSDANYYARDLRNTVMELAMTDLELFPDAILEVERPDAKTFQMAIDDDFRKEQLLEGIELPRIHSFQCSLSSLKPSQREILWDMYFPTRGRLPERLVLYTPAYDESTKELKPQSEQWRGRINPLASSPEEVIDAWEADYELALGAVEV